MSTYDRGREKGTYAILPIVEILGQLPSSNPVRAKIDRKIVSLSEDAALSNPSNDRLALVDVGVGNWSSLLSLLRRLGTQPVIVRHWKDLVACNRVILPGVGNFGSFSSALKTSGIWEEVRSSALHNAIPLLGICVGAQMLFDSSEESDAGEGLGIIPGVVKRLSPDLTKTIPRIGWDYLEVSRSAGLSEGVVESLTAPNRFYFSHSYFMSPTDRSVVKSTSGSSSNIPAIVSSSNIVGVQFHPERSSKYGASFLKAYLDGFFDAP